MSIQRYWILKARKLSGEATPEEQEELAALSVSMDDEARLGKIIEDNWDVQKTAAISEEEQARLLSLLQNKLPDVTRKDTNIGQAGHRLRAALLAMITLGCVFLVLWLFTLHKRQAELHEVVAARGTKTHVTLPDGTLVWLNGGSKLIYDDSYGRHNRILKLEGEAFFDVAKQAGAPFEVGVKDVTVQVLGTSFNLRAYVEENIVETALISGSVKLNFKQHTQPVQTVLKPMQKLILRRNTAAPGTFTPEWIQMKAERPEAVTETAWKESTLSFDAETFASLAIRLERWYNIRVIFTDARLKKLEFTGSIKGENIRDVMQVLSRSSGRFNYVYDQTNRTLTISTK